MVIKTRNVQHTKRPFRRLEHCDLTAPCFPISGRRSLANQRSSLRAAPGPWPDPGAGGAADLSTRSTTRSRLHGDINTVTSPRRCGAFATVTATTTAAATATTGPHLLRRAPSICACALTAPVSHRTKAIAPRSPVYATLNISQLSA